MSGQWRYELATNFDLKTKGSLSAPLATHSDPCGKEADIRGKPEAVYSWIGGSDGLPY